MQRPVADWRIETPNLQLKITLQDISNFQTSLRPQGLNQQQRRLNREKSRLPILQQNKAAEQRLLILPVNLSQGIFRHSASHYPFTVHPISENPSVGFQRGRLCVQQSITKSTSGMVTEDSATSVVRMIRRCRWFLGPANPPK